MRIGPSARLILIILLFIIVPFNVQPTSIAQAQEPTPVRIYEPSMNPSVPTPVSSLVPPPSSNASFSMPLPAPSNIAHAAPVSGTLRVLVIAAAFSDINYTISISALKQNFFGILAPYYHEVSLGSVTIQGDMYGWYTLPYPEAHYGRNCLAINDADCTGADGSWQIAQDAAPIAETKDNVNFNNYDLFVFIHSGYGQESSGVKDDVWSVTYLGGVYVRTNTRTLTKFNVDPELEASGAVPFGVYCHEFGHNLGLPDLYNTNTGKTILGPWELMDKGLWNGDPAGSSPAHMSAWPKIQLGFIGGSTLAVANPGVTTTYTVDPTEVASSNLHAIQIPLTATSNPAQYYLVEVRASVGYDAALPATGVLITYVDNTLIIGRVQVKDGHPSVANLNDAVWNVGQTFTDSNNNIAITITAQVGNSYQITVNRGGGQPPPPPQQPNQTAYVDLAVTNIIAQPQVITLPNTTVTITVQISNLGTAGVSNVLVQVNLDGQPYTSMQVSVGAGSSTETSFTWLSTVGGHIFQVIVDPNHTTNTLNYAKCVATFNISVGPTLTINVPLSITSAGNVWILINGVKYNITSTQFQSSVPNGTITIQIQSAVNTSLGVRQLFNGWADGNSANPRQIQVTTNTILQALYKTQYFLAVNPNKGTTTLSGWYDPNTIVTVSAVNPSNVTANASRLLFNGWSGAVTNNSTSVSLNMTQPLSLTANWVPQYYVTVISPTGSPTGSGWYNQGQIASVGVQSTVQYNNGTRQVFTGWNSTTLGQNPLGQFIVNSPTVLRAGWKTQYQVTIQSQYGAPSGSGWYDQGSTVSIIIIQPQIDQGNATRRIFKGWIGDYRVSSTNMTIKMNAPKNLNAQWSTQYQVTFKVNGLPNATIAKINLNNATYDLSINRNYQTWYEKGARINPTLNQTIINGFFIYKFSGWHNSTGATIQSPLTVNSPQTFVAFYSPEVTLPPVPGFPTEGTLLGILVGILLLACARRRRNKHSDLSAY